MACLREGRTTRQTIMRFMDDYAHAVLRDGGERLPDACDDETVREYRFCPVHAREPSDARNYIGDQLGDGE
jgi:hypothetical protein